MTNELPRLTDSSGALASRFVVFVLTKSFYRRENPQLTDELLTEAPGDLQLGRSKVSTGSISAATSLSRSRAKRRPRNSKTYRRRSRLSSRDRCVVGRDRQVEVGRLWSAWKSWCETENHAPGTKVLFGRDLHAAMPTVRKTRRRKGEHRVATYEGIGLRLAVGGKCLDFLR